MTDFPLFVFDPSADGESRILKLGALRSESFDQLTSTPECKAIQDLLSETTPKAGNPGRAIIVRTILKDHEAWVSGEPSVARFRSKLGRLPTRCEPGQQFANAKAASAWLGFHNNEVSYALAKVSTNPDPNERMAQLRGVELQYLDDAVEGVRD